MQQLTVFLNKREKSQRYKEDGDTLTLNPAWMRPTRRKRQKQNEVTAIPVEYTGSRSDCTNAD